MVQGPAIGLDGFAYFAGFGVCVGYGRLQVRKLAPSHGVEVVSARALAGDLLRAGATEVPLFEVARVYLPRHDDADPLPEERMIACGTEIVAGA